MSASRCPPARRKQVGLMPKKRLFDRLRGAIRQWELADGGAGDAALVVAPGAPPAAVPAVAAAVAGVEPLFEPVPDVPHAARLPAAPAQQSPSDDALLGALGCGAA